MKLMLVRKGQSHRIHGYRHVGGVRLCDVEPRCNQPWPCYDHGTRMVIDAQAAAVGAQALRVADVIDVEFEDDAPSSGAGGASVLPHGTACLCERCRPPAPRPAEFPPFWVTTGHTGIYSASHHANDRGVSRRADCWAWRVPGGMYTACPRTKVTLLEALLASFGFEVDVEASSDQAVYWLGGTRGNGMRNPRVFKSVDSLWRGRVSDDDTLKTFPHWWEAVAYALRGTNGASK